VPPASFARRTGAVPCVPRPKDCGSSAPRCHGAGAGAAVVAHGTFLQQSSHTEPCPPVALKNTRAPAGKKAKSVAEAKISESNAGNRIRELQFEVISIVTCWGDDGIRSCSRDNGIRGRRQ